MKILLVDDSNFQRRKFQTFLEEHKYEVIPTGTKENAIERLEKEDNGINLVLTDIDLGRGNSLAGFELLQKIKEGHKNLPVIGMSFTHPKIENDFRRKGGDEFFVKPKFWAVKDEELLLQKIKGCLPNENQ